MVLHCLCLALLRCDPEGASVTPLTCPILPQLSGFTSDPREVCSCLYDLETIVCKSFSILWEGGQARGCRVGGERDPGPQSV